jgi:dolichol-phosphate mannosyltransferase
MVECTQFSVDLKDIQYTNSLNTKTPLKPGLIKSSVEVIIAALNEQDGIYLTIEELKTALKNPRILVVDGNSTDKTVEVAKKLGARVVYQDGQGKGDALAKGIACLEKVDYVVITDADFTYPAEHINEMLRILEERPEVGMVCGDRFQTRTDPKAQRSIFYIGNLLIAFAHNTLNGVQLNDPLTGLRVVRAKLLKDWKIQSKGFDIEVELNHYVERSGCEIVEIPIQYRPRVGEKKLKVRHGAAIFKRIILETLS